MIAKLGDRVALKNMKDLVRGADRHGTYMLPSRTPESRSQTDESLAVGGSYPLAPALAGHFLPPRNLSGVGGDLCRYMVSTKHPGLPPYSCLLFSYPSIQLGNDQTYSNSLAVLFSHEARPMTDVYLRNEFSDGAVQVNLVSPTNISMWCADCLLRLSFFAPWPVISSRSASGRSPRGIHAERRSTRRKSSALVAQTRASKAIGCALSLFDSQRLSKGSITL